MNPKSLLLGWYIAGISNRSTWYCLPLPVSCISSNLWQIFISFLPFSYHRWRNGKKKKMSFNFIKISHVDFSIDQHCEADKQRAATCTLLRARGYCPTIKSKSIQLHTKQTMMWWYAYPFFYFYSLKVTKSLWYSCYWGT